MSWSCDSRVVVLEPEEDLREASRGRKIGTDNITPFLYKFRRPILENPSSKAHTTLFTDVKRETSDDR